MKTAPGGDNEPRPPIHKLENTYRAEKVVICKEKVPTKVCLVLSLPGRACSLFPTNTEFHLK